ncbi:MAG: hypothetical protein QNJ02_13295 [Desulfobacterales bacterium]|nr:hypothetical protein [Desulfobacterales bacterium]MDJ0876240.1 hypothetical protein [Desulfobacterales bacterium]
MKACVTGVKFLNVNDSAAGSDHGIAHHAVAFGLYKHKKTDGIH